MKAIRKSPAKPEHILEWAISNDLNVSEALAQSVQGGAELTNWKAKYFAMKRLRDELAAQMNESVAGKERTSFLRLILGMARSKFSGKTR